MYLTDYFEEKSHVLTLYILENGNVFYVTIPP